MTMDRYLDQLETILGAPLTAYNLEKALARNSHCSDLTGSRQSKPKPNKIMPSIKEIGTILQFKWDDDSTEEIKIAAGAFDESGNYVRIQNGDDDFYIKEDAWELMREKIDALFSENGEDGRGASRCPDPTGSIHSLDEGES